MSAREFLADIVATLLLVSAQGSLPSLVVLAGFSCGGCMLFCDAFANQEPKPYARNKSTKPKLLAMATGGLFFVLFFLHLAAHGWHDPIVLILLGIRSLCVSILVFSATLVSATIGYLANQYLILFAKKLPGVINVSLRLLSWVLAIVWSLFEEPDEPEPVSTEVIVEPADYLRDRLADAKNEYQARCAMLPSSGLDNLEQDAVRMQLKQTYLREIRSILKNNS